MPKIGDIVIYKVDPGDSEVIRNNNAYELPAIVVAVWGPHCVNAQVFCDGEQGTDWKTSILRGGEPGQWYVPGDGK